MFKNKKFLLDEKVAQTLLDYLAGKPYREVFKLIHELQHLPCLPNDCVEMWLTQLPDWEGSRELPFAAVYPGEPGYDDDDDPVEKAD
jgi:hypothetical protein